MTNDYTIQPQVVQERKNPMPSALLGAGIGAGAGWATSAIYNHTRTGAKSYEDLVKIANDADKVELTSKKDALTKAEAALTEAGKAVYEGPEKEALAKAIKNRDAELERLTKNASSSYERVIPKEAKEMPIPEGMKFEDFEKKYSPLKQAYDNAVSTAESQKSGRYYDAKRKYENVYDATKEALDPKKSKKNTIVKKVENTILPKQSKLTNEQLKELGDFVAETDNKKIPKLKKATEELHRIKDKSGNLQGYVIVPKGTAAERLKEVNKEIKEQQKEIVDELLEKLKERKELNTKIVGFDADFLKECKDDLKLANLVDSSGNVSLAELKTTSYYENQLKILKEGIPADMDIITAEYGVTTTGEAKKIINKRNNIAQKYHKDKDKLDKAYKAILEKDPRVVELKNIKDTELHRDRGVKKTYNRLRNEFASIFGEKGSTGLTEAQAMEKDSYKRLAKIVEDKQAIYDKLASEKGKVNETAKKTAQEAVEKAKGELDNLITKLGGKVKGMSGAAKAALIGGLAVVGGLVGYNAVNKNNKA